MSVARWLVTGATVAIAAGLVVGAKRLARASHAAERARLMLVEAEGNATSLRAARRETPWVGTTMPIESDLSPRVLETMKAVGIEAGHLKSVRQTRDAAVAAGTGGAVRRRTVSVSIEAVTMPEVAAYLNRWESHATEWTIARVDIQRNASGDGEGTLRVELVCTYASERINGSAMARATGG